MHLTFFSYLFYINQLYFMININLTSTVLSLKASFPINHNTQWRYFLVCSECQDEQAILDQDSNDIQNYSLWNMLLKEFLPG